MDSTRRASPPSPAARLDSVGGQAEGWPAIEQALLALGTDAGMTPALKTRLLEAACGLSYHDISVLHKISLNTVKTQVNAMLKALGASCCCEVRDSARAACARAEAGAPEDEIVAFLRLRLE